MSQSSTPYTQMPLASFVSLGPGDPEMLTVKAVRQLQQADIVIVPSTGKQSRAADIASHWCSSGRIETFLLPMLKDRSAVMSVYDDMAQRIASLHRQGLRVVVAVEGDISIYASIHYVMERLQADGVPVEQVAGIPSFIAAASHAGLSLASGQQRLTVIPGDADEPTLLRLLDSNHVVVIMKLSQCRQVLKSLLQHNPDIECHYFENVGTPDVFYITQQSEILSRDMPYFSLCILSSCKILAKTD